MTSAITMLNLLRLPELSKMTNLDNPNNIHVLRAIIQRKPFLRKTYKSFYHQLLVKIQTIPADGKIVELGSGASFLKKYNSQIITSDVLPYDGVELVFSALDMPFEDNDLSAILMIDVLHHIKDSRQFFREADRCLKPGGKLVMIEPANTCWSKFIYNNFHHEPFNPRGYWGFEEGGPLSGANMAIPWIIFNRDSELFREEFPSLRVRSIKIHTPLRYLISGGLSMRQLLPSALFSLVQFMEWLLSPLNAHLGMFMTIELEKVKVI
ncbi:MAG: class I SAM-dependent methyltransferase [Moorea sp. SIOASIH]|uniref:class I SAM-dependent methyltransferase n=1 Tax=Moorena sp. SIOASIH TaxID=2607817 RepID=UPI0013BAECF5|nr:class I SAM-dependent methyltransferase [Moorena sp. SIOASIH]NEO39178.1 class I SAM-dependent methyltransferase [Moorena sp. SIOASIH]